MLKSLELLKTMSVCAKDFLSRKIAQNIWPVIKSKLNVYNTEFQDEEERRRKRQQDSKTRYFNETVRHFRYFVLITKLKQQKQSSLDIAVGRNKNGFTVENVSQYTQSNFSLAFFQNTPTYQSQKCCLISLIEIVKFAGEFIDALQWWS